MDNEKVISKYTRSHPMSIFTTRRNRSLYKKEIFKQTRNRAKRKMYLNEEKYKPVYKNLIQPKR